MESPLGRHGLSKFTWRFECTLMSAEKYSQQFVLPLFTMTVALSHQTDLMEAILQRKDREIAEHVANGSVVKRGTYCIVYDNFRVISPLKRNLPYETGLSDQ